MDPLLECLVILTQLNHRPYSPNALLAGLPLVNQRLTPSLFVRAAERVGLEAKIFQKPIEQISNLILPAVLILKDEQACILTNIYDDQTIDVIFPGNSQTTSSNHRLEELSIRYTGYAILVHTLPLKTNEKSIHNQNSNRWFWNALWHYRYIYLQVVIAACFTNLFGLVSPLFVMNVYDRVVPNNAFSTLWVLSMGVVIIFIFDFILRTLRSYLIDVCGKKADIAISSALFQQVLGMRMSKKPASAGAFVSHLREFEILREFFTSATLTALIDIPFVVFFLILIVYLGNVVAFVPATAAVLTLVCAWLLEKPLQQTVSLATQSSTHKNGILMETVIGLETIKCLTAEGASQKKWEQHVGSAAKLGLQSRFLSGLIINIVNLIQQLVTVGVVVIGVYAISTEHLTLGGLIACSILSGRALAPLSTIANLLTRFQQAKMALTSLNAIMNMPVERPREKRFLHLPKLQGNIEFEAVSFQYPDSQTLALDNVSFKITAGERVAIIGRIGSGKSTIQKLLLGLYQPTAGHIRIDGIDIQQIDPIDLRRHIGYAPQDSLLFLGTVRDNIMMSMPSATDSEMVQAANLAGVDVFINRHPFGYDMRIGERGEGLSGGQRQAIVLARALLPSTGIWLFDEPTSAMDNSSEIELLQRLTNAVQHKTFILASHKITLFPLVNRLLVMNASRLIVDGPRDEVLKRLSQPVDSLHEKK